MDVIALNAADVDLKRREIRRAEQTLRLTRIEHRLMQWFARHPGELFSQAELLEAVWGYLPGTRSCTVYTTIQRLRRKLEIDPRHPRHLQTVYGVGYRFEP
ncbi:MAG: winged helix-turn-helix domain-containing protein [Myxococcota bacterium]|nr:winged helix-turn-helix domain-containing protein [Myxococcota bacterium]